MITGVIAGALGYRGIPEVRKRRQATQHAVGNVAVVSLLTVNGLWRVGDAEAVVVPWGLAVSLLTPGLLGFTGYLGGLVPTSPSAGPWGQEQPMVRRPPLRRAGRGTALEGPLR